MGKMREQYMSLRWRFLIYFSVCAVAAYLGVWIIGMGTNHLQAWYLNKQSDKESIYFVISNAQVILMPVWVMGCMLLTGAVFYYRELKKPIGALMQASKKISENQLDFTMDYHKKNELGELCEAFEEMRSELYNNNLKLWHTLEERKRLNSAFSHDLRTPLTVLRGYVDYLEKYVPEEKVPEEKLLSVLALMSGQIGRLEHYTQKMNDAQKLEDLVPNRVEIAVAELEKIIRDAGGLLCGKKEFVCTMSFDCECCYIDPELLMQVYENLIANAFRYGEKAVHVDCRAEDGVLRIVVEDDGGGFTQEGLRSAAEPFFRDEKEPDKTHFGLGLYICRILCEKCGGRLTIENSGNGGRVTAAFDCKKLKS